MHYTQSHKQKVTQASEIRESFMRTQKKENNGNQENLHVRKYN